MFQYALNNYNYKILHTKKWLVFKQEKQSFAMMMQYLNGPTLLSKAKKAKQPLP